MKEYAYYILEEVENSKYNQLVSLSIGGSSISESVPSGDKEGFVEAVLVQLFDILEVHSICCF